MWREHSAAHQVVGMTPPIRALTQLVGVCDRSTQEHCERVAVISRAIALSMSLPPAQVADVELAARLHDVGKLLVPSSILMKKGRLTDHEYDCIKTHSIMSRQIVAADPRLAGIAVIVGQHHERIDGRGYPDGLSGDEITLEARIIACADALDAMTASRPYREALTSDAALAELANHAGSQFDPLVVDTVLDVFATVA